MTEAVTETLSAIAFPILQAWGFDATALDAATGRTTNATEALFVLTMLYAALPIAVKLIAMALMWNFPLDATRQRALRTELEERQAG